MDSPGRRHPHYVAQPHWPRGTLLAQLSPTSEDELVRSGTLRVLEHGTVLLSEQDSSTHAVLLLDGFAKVTANLGNGKIAMLGIRMVGDLIGEMSALDGSPRSATVTACGRLTTRVIPQREFLELLRLRPDMAIAVSGMISHRLRWANRRRADFSGYPSRVRLARVLVELASAYGHREDGGVAFDLELTQEELGTLAGADADTAGRELRRLRTQGVISTGYRSTTIRELDRLRELAWPDGVVGTV
jgi:CRP-like cAMP-binding protein